MDGEYIQKNGKTLRSLQKSMDLSSQKHEIYQNVLYVPGVLRPCVFGAVLMKCFSVRFLREHGLKFQPKLRKTQDRVFMLEAVCAASKIYYAPVMSYVYIENDQSITHKLNFKMLDYCHRVYKVISGWCNDNNMDTDSRKFFGFELFMEMLNLTYLHPSCKCSLRQKVRGIAEQYDHFSIAEDTRHCKLSDYEFRFAKTLCLTRKLFGKWGFSVLVIFWNFLRRVKNHSH